MRYREKYIEMQFYLKGMEASFLSNDGSYLHFFNGFLSAAQSVFFCLNKEFSMHPLYQEWQSRRSERLPDVAKIFRELRNVSEKEGPVKNSGTIAEFKFPEGTMLPPFASFTSPSLDTHTGKFVSNKGTITTKDGEKIEVELQQDHDFCVTVQSNGKSFRLGKVIHDARKYATAIQNEMDEAEAKFAGQL